VVRRVEAVERPCPELVEVEVAMLRRVVVRREDEDTGAGLGPEDVVDDAA